jgi:hypothetical protein
VRLRRTHPRREPDKLDPESGSEGLVGLMRQIGLVDR